MKTYIYMILVFLYTSINAQTKYFNVVFEDMIDFHPTSLLVKEDNSCTIVGYSTFNFATSAFVLNIDKYGSKEFFYEDYSEEEIYAIFFQDIIKTESTSKFLGFKQGPDISPSIFLKKLSAENDIHDEFYIDTLKQKRNLYTGIQTSDKGFLLSGYGEDPPDGFKPYLIKVSNNMVLEWDTLYSDFPSFSHIKGINQSSKGSYYVGLDVKISDFSFDSYLWETDSLGNRIRFKHFNYAAYDYFENFIPTHDGGILVALGSYNGYQRIIKLNSDWEEEFVIKDYFYNSAIKGLAELPDSSLIILGSVAIYDDEWNDHRDDIQLVKLNQNGEHLWNRIFYNPGVDTPVDLIASETGEISMLCRGRKYFEEYKENLALPILIKTNCLGLLTEPEASFTFEETAGELTFTNTSLYVYPDSIDGGYYEWDFGDGSPLSNEVNPVHTYTEAGEYQVRLTGIVCSDTSVYEQTISVTTTSVASPSLSDVLRVYPNPVEGDVLYFEVSGNFPAQQGRILFYNTLGQLALQSAFKNKVDVRDLLGGVYFVVVEVGGKRVVEKVVVN